MEIDVGVQQIETPGHTDGFPEAVLGTEDARRSAFRMYVSLYRAFLASEPSAAWGRTSHFEASIPGLEHSFVAEGVMPSLRAGVALNTFIFSYISVALKLDHQIFERIAADPTDVIFDWEFVVCTDTRDVSLEKIVESLSLYIYQRFQSFKGQNFPDSVLCKELSRLWYRTTDKNERYKLLQKWVWKKIERGMVAFAQIPDLSLKVMIVFPDNEVD